MVDFSPENLRVIFPVGGEAKRLRPLTSEVSKACVRLVNRPLIEISMASLAKQGVRNFIFGVKGYVNYKSLHDYFKEGIGFSTQYKIEPRVHIKYAPNEDDVGSADCVRRCIEYYDIQEPVFGVQGDNIFDIDLQDLINYHCEKQALMTIGLTNVEQVEDYGIADLDKNLRIKKFVEKPKKEEAPSTLANTGIYLLSPQIREVFKEKPVKDMIFKQKRLDFGMDFIPYLIETQREVYGYILRGTWYDVGTPKRYLDAMIQILHGHLKCLSDFGGRISEDEDIWIECLSLESEKRKNEIIEKIRREKIKIEGPVLIGRHCQIGDGVTIKSSCIDNFTIIGDGCYIEKAAILDRARIGEYAEIQESIIGRHSIVKSSKAKPTKIKAISVLGDDVIVEEGCEIIASKIYPHLCVISGKKLLYEDVVS
ncbi:MAG: NDP-sugar synthase [Methanocellales archaeon]